MNKDSLRVRKYGSTSSWYVLPFPQSIKVELRDMDREENTYMNQNGYLKRDRARGGATVQRKVLCTFPPLTMTQLHLMLQAIGHEWLELSYPDPYTGTYRSGKFYVGDRTQDVYKYDVALKEWVWTDIAFDFVEE